VEISPDNLYTAVVGRHSSGIFIYEIKTGNTKFRYDEVWPISISYRFDGQRLVSASRNGIITVFDTTKGEEIMTFIIPPRNEHDKTNKVSYSPDGNKIIVSSVNQISIWDANNGIELKTLTEQDALVLDAYASFSQDGTKIIMSYWIFSGREGARYRYIGKIRIYDATHYVLLYSYDLGDETSDRSRASFVVNSNYIIILYYRVRVRDGVVVAVMNYTDGNIINTYTFNFYTLWAIGPDGRSVCYSERKNDINILRIN
jgi:WD40 repeat protein